MSSLDGLSAALAETVQSLKPSLVRVPGIRGSATGIAWSSGDLIVTTAGIASRRDRFELTLPSGETAEAVVRGRDHALDLTLLEVAGAELAVPKFAEAPPEAGHIVGIVGRRGRAKDAGRRSNAGVGDVHIALGVVRSVGEAWQTGRGARVDAYIEVDGELAQGFSGGPLVNTAGEILGVNTRRLVRGGTTLPASTLIRALTDLRDHGAPRRAWLGVGGVAVPLAQVPLLDEAPDPAPASAVLLTTVQPDSPAARSGLLLGDAIVAVGGADTPSVQALVRAVAGQTPDEAVSLRVLRAGRFTDASVVLGSRA
jgi:S1-C subfamily serine protease